MRVGVLQKLVYARFDHSAGESSDRPSSARTIPSSSPAARSRSSLTTRWANSSWAASSSSATSSRASIASGAVGAAAVEALAQDRRVRRRDEDLDRLAHRRPHLAGALDLDLEHDRVPGREPPLDLRAQRPVAVAAVGGVLEEVFASHPRARTPRARGSGSRGRRPRPRAAPGSSPRSRARDRAGAASSSRISVPLPTPEGPVMTKTLAAMRPRILTGAAVG